jgi:tetratricopeptide (TPR) repeat protein
MLKTIKGFLLIYRLHDKFDKLVWAKDFRKIVAFAEEVKSRFPTRPIGYFYSGYGKLNLSKYEESKPEFLKTLDLLKTRNNRSEKKFYLYYSYLNMGSAYDSLNEYDKALLYCEKAIRIDQNKYEAFLNRGIVRMKSNNKLDALKDFEKVLELDINNLIASQNKEILIMELMGSDLNTKDKNES